MPRAFHELLTPRLRIRRLAPRDAEALQRYRSLPAVSRFQGWDEFSEGDATQLIRSMSDAEPGTPGEWFQFAVALRETDALIGDIGLQTRDSEHERTWIGFTLDPGHSRQGYMTEAVRAVFEFAGASLGVDAVWASCDPRNPRSRALLDRVGFVRVREELHAYELKGEWVDDWTYRLGKPSSLR